MNLADAIRKAAHEVSSSRTSLLDPVEPPPFVSHQREMEPIGFPEPPMIADGPVPDPPDVSAEDGKEMRMSASGNVVRLELFMTPEQMTIMLRAIMAGQHSVLTAKEAASYLRVAQSTLEKLAESGDIPAVEIEGRWRFPKNALDDWMLRQSTRSFLEAETEDNSDAA